MKRSKECVSSILKKVNVILLDIEGTTTSISFVKVSKSDIVIVV